MTAGTAVVAHGVGEAEAAVVKVIAGVVLGDRVKVVIAEADAGIIKEGGGNTTEAVIVDTDSAGAAVGIA